MLTFTQVKYKNILSTGNAWTTIELNRNKSTLIVGENGAGKSTILDAISFALYGKAFRKINKPQLMNSINQRDLSVEVYFQSNGAEFVIKRGMKPNLFEIWKNGELLNQDASARDYQAYLEDSILKMNYKSFGQVVVLGSSTFVPFMQLPAQHRREVIEDLLDIQIFSTMNNLLKEKVNTNKADLVQIKYDVDLVKTKIDSAKEHNESIRKLKESEVSRIKEKMRERIEFIEGEESRAEELEEQITALIGTISDKAEASSKLQQFKTLRGDLNTKLGTLHKDVKFYHAHDNCPTCRQGIEHDFKASTINEKSAKISEIENAILVLDDKAAKVEERLSNIANTETEIHKLSLARNEHTANIRIAKSTIVGLKKELDEAEKNVAEIDTSKIVGYKEELKILMDKAKDLSEDKETLAVVGSMLKDGGIKTRIIKQYVPIMNKLINKYLAAMEFFVDFQLDESFNEKILSRFRDEFSYASFSEGEKLRIDLALMFTWRAVSKLRNSVTTNLLIMDEVLDGSLDQAGTDEFLKIVNEITADSNVFIISHKGDSLHDKFDHVIKFEKKKNFSQIAA
jgi:DNA repair exonuclease SbcCD ATPase subunit